ncbi:MAG: ABC transporter permease [Burkholderiaceae bacterium]|jgi:putative spermidine/putrescine transport system permease protein|nr:ABC transporter permease [Burkholderiaceae bacterium]
MTAIAPPVMTSTQQRPLLREWQLALPLGIFFVVFVFFPLLMLGYVSLHRDEQLTTHGLDQYAKFFGDAFNWRVLGNTLLLGLQVTGVALLIGYPLAYLYSVSSRRVQQLLIFLILLPLLTSAVVRTFAWIVILGRQGIINTALLELGWIEAPLKLLYTPAAVTIALAQIEMALMVLPLITAFGHIDPNLAHASRALGAGRWRTFFQVTLPLSMPGLLAGCLLVFAAAVSAFVTQTLVGGGQQLFMPFYMYQQAVQANNYPFAATIAMTLLLSVLAIVTLVNLLGRRSTGFVHG